LNRLRLIKSKTINGFDLDYSSVLNDQNILVTGGTGSFGHQMIKELMMYKPKIIRIFSRDEDKQHLMRQEFSDDPIIKRMQFVIGDVRDYDRIYTAAKDIDIIFHAAALKQVPAVETGVRNPVGPAKARHLRHAVQSPQPGAAANFRAKGIHGGPGRRAEPADGRAVPAVSPAPHQPGSARAVRARAGATNGLPARAPNVHGLVPAGKAVREDDGK